MASPCIRAPTAGTSALTMSMSSLSSSKYPHAEFNVEAIHSRTSRVVRKVRPTNSHGPDDPGGYPNHGWIWPPSARLVR